MKTYEAMFLLDADSPDFDAACAPIRDALGRAKAEVVSLKPWDERRLAYDVNGRRRALYVLTYFRAEPAELATLQHEVQLDERILRALVLSADHVSEEKIRAETPATLTAAKKAADAERVAQRAARAEQAAREKAAAAEEAKAKAQAKPAEAPEPAEPPAGPAKAEPSPGAEAPAPAGQAPDQPEEPPKKPAAPKDDEPQEPKT
jgi:small subunit ribosomal protein S6